MNKMITIDGNRYVLPEAMTQKDIQTLAGLLVTLVRIDYEYCYGEDDSQHYAVNGAAVSIGQVELVTRAEAKAAAEKSRQKYEAKKAAEKAAA